MKRFWSQKSPFVQLVWLAGLDIILFLGVTDQSRFGYWPPVILLGTLIFALLNNIRIDRMNAKATEPPRSSD
jgi:hypothetical protein